MSEVVLHQWELSPYCGKVRRMLALKNISYRKEDYNGVRAGQAAKLSKVGKLPVLDIDGHRIQDTRRIGEYLEEAYPENPMIPKDRAEQAEAELLADWGDESLYWYNVYFRMNYEEAWSKTARSFAQGRSSMEQWGIKKFGRLPLRQQMKGQGIGRYPKREVEGRFLKLLDSVDGKLLDRKWLVGNAMSLADISVASQLAEIYRTSHLASEMQNREALFDWLTRMDLPSREFT